jgi:hypothetical protein
MTALMMAIGCSGVRRAADSDPSGDRGGEDAGAVVLALTVVPADVQCVRVVVTGTQVVTRTFDVTAGQATTLMLGGLPLGAVTIVESAFSVSCSTVGMNSVATWVSEAPLSLNLVSGQSASATVVLRRPAGANLTNDFQEGSALTVTPPSKDFGALAVGTNAAQPFTVMNMGSAVAGPLAAGLNGANPDQFALVMNGCAGVSLPAGGTCSVTVQFAPTSAGSKAAALVVSGSTGQVSAALTGSGVAGAMLTIMPPTKDFGSQAVGTISPSQMFTVTNVGSSAAGPLGTMLSGANPTEFAAIMDGCAGMTLAPNSTCSVTASFNPTSAGAKTATLTVSGGGGTVSAMLAGTGVASATLTITPPTKDFGSQTVGTSGPSLIFTVKNTGMSAAGPLGTMLSGANPTEFAAFMDGCAGMTLAPNSTCSVSASFNPTSAGAKTATLTVSGGGGTVSAILAGTGVAPTTLTIAPSMKDFGSQTVGASSPSQIFTVTNVGTSAAGPLGTMMSGANPTEFAALMDGCAGLTLAPNGTCSVTANFKPTSAGAKTATLAVSGGGATVSATLAGKGVAPTTLTISPATKDFGSQAVGSTGANQSFVVTNTGTSATGPLGTALSGANPTEFPEVMDACIGLMLAPGGTCSLTAHFAPTSVGAKSATLTVSGAGGSVSAMLVGSALPAWSSLDVGTVAAAGSWSQAGGVYSVNGSGADIYGTADAFRFVYQNITGDATITARVTSVQAVAAWTKAALMMRDGTTAGARNVAALVSATATNLYRFQNRVAAAGASTSASGGTGAIPVWLRLVRVGSNFTGYFSTNGTSWTQLGATTNIAMPTTIAVGLAVTSHLDGTVAQGTFDSLSITQP